MPYGQSFPSGHGCRRTRYIWTPTYENVPRRRKRNHAAAHRSASHGKRLCETGYAERLLSRLCGEDWRETVKWARQGKPHPNWYVSLLSIVFFGALAANSLPFCLFALFRWVLMETALPEREAKKYLFSSHCKITKSIRKMRKTSVNDPPTPEAIRKAWKAARTTLDGKLLAGTLLSDLEPVVDQSYIRNTDGTIVGRRAGIKGWLASRCPDMLPHYKALMSYKALADKLRLALGVEEPDTLSGVLDFDSTMSGIVEGSEAGETDGIPKSLKIRKSIILLKSNKLHVIENIHSIRRTLTGMKEGVGTKARHDPGRGKRANGEPVRDSVSMAALDATLRERLGIVGMRRTRWRRRAA